MKILLFSPYVPKHVGGGEKYFFDVARILATRHQVFVAISSLEPLSLTEVAAARAQYEAFMQCSLANIEFIATPLGTTASALNKIWWTKQFDCIYYVTDGSLFWSLAPRNVLHIQVPLQLTKSSWLEQRKLANWQLKNTNSYFTKSVIEPWWQTTVDVVHQPMVNVPGRYTNQPKEKIIVSVGRFFRQLHSKRQDILVQMFAELQKQEPTLSRGWKLILIGGVEDQSYAQEVATLAVGLPIEFKHSLKRPELLDYLARASIYWHAAGYDVDETTAPEKVEHFGISTVEAMQCGALPLVHAKGGQKEVLGESLAHLGWQTTAEGIKLTTKAITDHTWWESQRLAAQQQGQTFSEAVFAKKLWQMVEGT